MFGGSMYTASGADNDIRRSCPGEYLNRELWETCMIEASGAHERRGITPVSPAVNVRSRTGSAELESQLKRALDEHPGATCEVRIYGDGAVMVCE
jgi:hypothetical protein